MRVLDLAIAAVGATLIGVALWVFVVGGPSGKSEPSASQPPASQAGLTPTSVQEPTAMSRNRRDCDAIPGTDYLSPEERTWFLNNCITSPVDQPPPPPPPPAASAADHPPAPPPAAPSADQPLPPAATPPEEEPPAPPPPAEEPPPPPPEEEPAPPDDDLRVRVSQTGRGGPYTTFSVYIENLSASHNACDIMLQVGVLLNDSSTWVVGEPVFVDYLGRFEDVQFFTTVPVRAADWIEYDYVVDWAWC